MLDRLKTWGDIEIPLSVVVVIVAIAILVVNQPQKEVYYMTIPEGSQKLHGV